EWNAADYGKEPDTKEGLSYTSEFLKFDPKNISIALNYNATETEKDGTITGIKKFNEVVSALSDKYEIYPIVASGDIVYDGNKIFAALAETPNKPTTTAKPKPTTTNAATPPPLTTNETAPPTNTTETTPTTTTTTTATTPPPTQPPPTEQPPPE
ncbi:MAG: hypothetical protein LBN42_00820, partial [Oscillospiraceae bacterium]|nr:hypothetical protein [Oscillospiraceae bacterium]